jgi:hypothetical protein
MSIREEVERARVRACQAEQEYLTALREWECQHSAKRQEEKGRLKGVWETARADFERLQQELARREARQPEPQVARPELKIPERERARARRPQRERDIDR